jgi:hypothetical protein
MVAWPGTLPLKPLMNGYQDSLDDPKVRTPMDTSVAKVRNRFTAVVYKFMSNFIFTDAELTIFEDFYKTDLSNGALSFTWNHPRTGVAITARIKGVYQTAPVSGGLYRTQFEVEILP